MTAKFQLIIAATIIIYLLMMSAPAGAQDERPLPLGACGIIKCVFLPIVAVTEEGPHGGVR